MKTSEAVSMMLSYGDWISQKSGFLSSQESQVLALGRGLPKSPKKDVVMHRLGFVQGWMFANGLFTFNELKDHREFGDVPWR